MQLIPPLTRISQIATDLGTHEGRTGSIVATSAWSGGLRTLCLVFGLTLGWIVLFDPSLVSGLSIQRLAGFLSSL